MKLRSGQSAILGVTLLACLLVASLPSRVVRLSFCECGETTLALASTDDESCYCPDQSLAESSCGGDCESGSCGASEREPAAPQPERPDDDSCCTHLAVPDLLSSSWSSQDDWWSDADLELDPTMSLSQPGQVDARLRDLRASATGPPPPAHHIRRGLVERRAIVLLI